VKLNQSGMSLVEALLVVVVVSSMTFLIASLPNALGLTNKSKHLSIAREIAAKQIEDKRTIKYKDLINGSSLINDSRLNLLPQASGKILVEDCGVELCKSKEQIKQVTISITWKDNNKLQTITLNTLISKEGLNQ